MRDRRLERVLVQVKGGHVKSGDVRDLRGVVERENAAIGVFVTLEEPSREMITEAVSAGFFHSNVWNKDYPKIQILTVQELLNEAEVSMPAFVSSETFKKADKVKKKQGEQGKLDL